MKKLILLALFTVLTIFISGCSNTINNLTTTSPNVDNSFQTVNYDSIKTMPDMTSIGFEWQKIDDPRVIGYNIYRTELDKGENSLKLIKATNSRYVTHYVDKNLEPKTKYAYQISAKLNNGKESPTTQAYIVETQPRIVPISFAKAISNLPRQIKLIWQPHPDHRVSYYRVEKYNNFLNEWTWASASKIDHRLEAEYIETGLKDSETCRYRIKAFSFSGVESAPSQILEATTKALPLSIIDLKASNNIPKKIYLTWQASPTEDVVQYQIHRSSYSGFGYSKIATVESSILEYTDSINNDAIEYYYKVIAVDKDHLESKFDIEPVKGATLAPPAKPILTLAQIQGNKAILNWQAADSRAVSYIVNKRVNKYLVMSDIKQFKNISELRFEDFDIVSGVEYNYSVQAVDEFGIVSKPSDEAKISLPDLRK